MWYFLENVLEALKPQKTLLGSFWAACPAPDFSLTTDGKDAIMEQLRDLPLLLAFGFYGIRICL